MDKSPLDHILSFVLQSFQITFPVLGCSLLISLRMYTERGMSGHEGLWKSSEMEKKKKEGRFF